MALDDAFGGTQVGYQTELANLGVQRSVARLHSAHAADLESQTAERNLANQVMASMATSATAQPQAPTTPPPPGSAQLDSLANLYGQTAEKLARGGAATTSMKFATEAATLRARTATMLNAEANARLHELDLRQKQLTRTNQLAASITNEQQFRAAQMEYLNENPGQDLPPIFREYNPALFESIRNGTAEGLKRLDLERKQLKDQAEAEWRKQQDQFRKDREARIERQAEERINLREKNTKAGGGKAPGVVGFPTEKEQTRAGEKIKELYPDLPTKEVDSYSFEVAAKAKALLKNTPGLDADQALERALTETAGEISTVDKTYFGFKSPFGGKESHFMKGASAKQPDLPQPLPSTKGDLKSGQIYQTTRGPARWNGTVFEKVQ